MAYDYERGLLLRAHVAATRISGSVAVIYKDALAAMPDAEFFGALQVVPGTCLFAKYLLRDKGAMFHKDFVTSVTVGLYGCGPREKLEAYGGALASWIRKAHIDARFLKEIHK